MYRKILVTLENSWSDEAILPHVTELARRFGSELLLLHVADGWRARNFNQLKLRESHEMVEDRAYLDKIAADLRAKGFSVSTMLALGEPPLEILKAAESEHCNLIAMAGHGHRFFGDIFHGSTITEVRHKTSIPIFVVRAEKK
jgi:universal stress protein A